MARRALDALGRSPSEHARLSVQCAHGHHVATVYDTPSGLVFAGRVQARGHGRRDLPDTPHRGHPAVGPWVDLLDPAHPADPALADEPLPAGCDCGPRSLSRPLLLQAIRDGAHRLVID